METKPIKNKLSYNFTAHIVLSVIIILLVIVIVNDRNNIQTRLAEVCNVAGNRINIPPPSYIQQKETRNNTASPAPSGYLADSNPYQFMRDKLEPDFYNKLATSPPDKPIAVSIYIKYINLLHDLGGSDSWFHRNNKLTLDDYEKRNNVYADNIRLGTELNQIHTRMVGNLLKAFGYEVEIDEPALTIRLSLTPTQMMNVVYVYGDEIEKIIEGTRIPKYNINL